MGNKTVFFAVCALGALALTSTAYALPKQGGVFARMDADHDGKITYEEASSVLPNLTEEKFAKHDANCDGFWSKEDLVERFRILPSFERTDADDDGQVTKEEHAAPFKAMQEKVFAQLDANEDSALTEDEMPRLPAGVGKGAGLDQGIANLLRGGGFGIMQLAFKAMDADKNDQVTQEEYFAAWLVVIDKGFDMRDANKDGVLTEDEMEPRGPRGLRGRQTPE